MTKPSSFIRTFAAILRKASSWVRGCLLEPQPRRRISPPANNTADSLAAGDDTAADPPAATPPDRLSAQPIDEQALIAAAQTIRRELPQRIDSGTCSQAAALDQVLILVFGKHRSAEERLRFLVFTVPLARMIALERADRERRVLDGDATVADVRELFSWCDAFDPLSARMLDLRYFAGVSVRQTAHALQIHPRKVVRDLRFTKAWLRVKLDKLE